MATVFSGRARRAHLSVIDGELGAAVVVGGVVRAVFFFEVETGRVSAVEIVADPAALSGMEIVPGA